MTDRPTPEESSMNLKDAFELGRQNGRKEVIEELRRLLDLDEYIAKQIAHHEEQYHNE